MHSRFFLSLLFLLSITLPALASFEDSTFTRICIDEETDTTEVKYIYNAFGNLKSGRSYRIKNNMHINQGASSYSYDGSQNLVVHIDSAWSYIGVLTITQYYYTYNASNLTDTFEVFSYSASGLTSQSREVYLYDVNDNLISTTYYSGIPLVPNQKEELQYDALGFISSKIVSSGSPLNYHHRNDFQKNTSGRDTIQISLAWQNNSWIPQSKLVTIYQPNDTLMMSVYNQLPDSLIGWRTINFDTLIYHANGHLLQSMKLSIQNGIIDTLERDVYTYNSFSPLSYHFSNDYYYGGIWDPIFWRDQDYDLQGNLISHYSSCSGCGYGTSNSVYNYNYVPGGLLLEYHSYSETHGGLVNTTDCYSFYFDIHGSFTVCQADTLTLSADSGFVNYLWSTGETTQSIRVYQQGTYTLSLTDTNGFTWSAAPHIVGLKAAPVASFATDSIMHVCRDAQNIILTEINLPWYNYQWLFNNQTLLPNNYYPNEYLVIPNYSMSGAYRVRVSNECGFDTSSSTIIYFSPDSIVKISPSGNQSICYGDSLTLTATPGYRYFWIPTLDTTQSISVWRDGHYTVQLYDSAGCYSSAAMDLSSTNFGHSAIYDVGDSILYFQYPGSGYLSNVSWLLNGDTIPGAHGNSLPLSGSGDYRVILTSTNGCLDTIGPYVSGLQLNLGVDVHVCSGVVSGIQSSQILNGYPPFHYIWTRDGVQVNSGNVSINNLPGVSFALSVSVIDTFIYVASITDSLGFADTDTQLVIVHPPVGIVPVITSDVDSVCNGLAANLTASPPGNYRWFHDGLAYSSVYSNTWNATSPAAYTCSIIDLFGCVSPQSNPIIIRLHPTPVTPSITVHGVPNCLGDTILLETAFNPNLVYHWQGTTISFDSISTSNLFNATSTNNYRVQTIDANGCQSNFSTMKHLDFDTLFTVPIIVYMPSVLCDGDSLRMESQSYPGYSYQWMNNHVAIPGANDSIYYAKENGLHYLRITETLTGCSAASNEWLVQVRPLNIISVTQADSVLTATPLFTSTFQWYNNSLLLPGEISNVFISHSIGDYYVEAIDYHGCRNISDTFNFDCALNLIAENVKCFNECNGSITALTNGVSPLVFEWSSGDTVNLIDTLCPGMYWVKISDGWGCSDSTGVVITQPTLMNVTLPDTFDLGCPGMCDTIFANVSGGNGGDIYQWSNGLLGIYAQHCDTVALTLTVTDSLGCIAVDSTIGKYSSSLDFAFSIIHPSCASCPDGQLSVSVQSGQAPFQLTFASNTYTIAAIGDTLTISSLTDGVYNLELQSGNGCSQTDSITLSHLLNTLTLNSKSGITIVPNPANGLCQVITDVSCMEKEILITSTENRVMKNSLYSGSSITIDLGSWSRGIYFVRVGCEDKFLYGRIVVH